MSDQDDSPSESSGSGQSDSLDLSESSDAAHSAGKAFIGGRRESRERAVHLLYEAQMKNAAPADVLASQVLSPDRYTTEVVTGVADDQEQLDSYIERLAENWTIKRMPVMDVVVLRVAMFELIHRPDVPRGAVLSEAVELAAQYGTDDSSRFVNGLLAAAAKEIRPE